MSAQPLNNWNTDAYTATRKGQIVANYPDNIKTAVWEFDITNPASESDTDTAVVTLPAGAVVKSADVFVKTALTGGTNFAVGLTQPDGSALDPDGLLAASTTLTVGYQQGGGNLLDTALTADGQLTVALTGSFTAGVLKVYVKYLVA